jgi:hypothetical protein
VPSLTSFRRLRRILDQKLVGEVKEQVSLPPLPSSPRPLPPLQLFTGNSSGLTEAAEQFLRTRDMDPLLSAIFLAVGMQ